MKHANDEKMNNAETMKSTQSEIVNAANAVEEAGEEEAEITGEAGVEMIEETFVVEAEDLSEGANAIRDHPLHAVTTREKEHHSGHESQIPTFLAGEVGGGEMIEEGPLPIRHHRFLPAHLSHGLHQSDDEIAPHLGLGLGLPPPAGLGLDRLIDENHTGAEEEEGVRTMAGGDQLPQRRPYPALHVRPVEEDQSPTLLVHPHRLSLVELIDETFLRDLDLCQRQDL